MADTHKNITGQFSDPRNLENAWFQEHRANVYAELHDAKTSTLDSISPQLEELEQALAEAQRENRAHDIADLSVQIAQLQELKELKLSQIALRDDEAKRYDADTRRAYALWRQTPDDQHFQQWLKGAERLYSHHSRFLKNWDAKYKSEALQQVSEQERRAAETDIWVDKPPLSIRTWVLLTVAGAGIVSSIIIQVLYNNGQTTDSFRDEVLFWTMLAGFVGAIASGGSAFFDRNSRAWRRDNQNTRTTSLADREQKFGYDPLSGAIPPSPFENDYRGYLDLIKETAVSGFEHHPAPSELPPLREPRFRPTSEIPFEPMAALLDRAKAEL